MSDIAIDTFRMRDHHGMHHDRPIIEVHMWHSVYARPGWRVQFYDAIWASPPVGHPYAYAPDEASTNRLLRALKGWDCRYDNGLFVWTRPPENKFPAYRAIRAEIARLEARMSHPDNCEGCEYCSDKETNE